MHRMLSRVMIGTAWLLAATPLVANDLTSQSRIPLVGLDGQPQWGFRCGTIAPDRDTLDQVDADLAAARWQHQRGRGSRIPVVFHVLYATGEAGSDVGRVPLEQIEAQIDVLNAAYADFEFELEGVDEVYAPQWFEKCFQREIDMKRSLAVTPESTLNVYTCVPQFGPYLLLGYAVFPWSFPEDNFRHGVVLHFGTLPGSPIFGGAYDEGDTATHEIGHYLGLLHTFQGGCTPPGDSVDDTPYEATPAFYCPHGRDSCPDLEGLDPIYNFMDYTDDWCMDHFTPLQEERMLSMVDLYRPSLSSARGP